MLRVRLRKQVLITVLLAGVAALVLALTMWKPALLRYHGSQLLSESASIETRVAAADAIGKTGWPEGATVLAQSLAPPEDVFQASVADGLETRCFDQLFESLGRCSACSAKLDSRLAASLRRLQQVSEADAFAATIWPLLRRGYELEDLVPADSFESGGGVRGPQDRQRLEGVLVTTWPAGRVRVFAWFESGDSERVRAALRILRRVEQDLDGPWLRAIVDLASVGSMADRRQAAAVLKEKRFVECRTEDARGVVALLDDPDATIRRHAINGVELSLHLSDIEELEAALVENTAHADFRVRRAAISALAACRPRSPAAVAVIAGALDDEHVAVREAALRVLDEFSWPVDSAHAGIVRLLADDTQLHENPDVRIRTLARSLLLKSGPSTLPAVRAGLAGLEGRARAAAEALIDKLRAEE